MTPLEIRRLVGHPDIVERLRNHWARNMDEKRVLCGAAAEVERLRTALRAVRGCSDPAWAKKLINEALGES